jgi:hypothetical protein
MLRERRMDEIAALAEGRRRVLGTLVSLTFDADDLVAWRAVEALGVATARVADRDTAFAREQLRRLLWLITEESGGICWRAPEAMAEIVAHRPDLFDDYVPIVVHLLLETAEEDLEHFRPGILWAIGRLGPLARTCVADVLPAIEAALDRPDAASRGMAVWCLGRVGHTRALVARPELAADAASVALYQEGELRPVTVALLRERALAE